MDGVRGQADPQRHPGRGRPRETAAGKRTARATRRTSSALADGPQSRRSAMRVARCGATDRLVDSAVVLAAGSRARPADAAPAAPRRPRRRRRAAGAGDQSAPRADRGAARNRRTPARTSRRTRNCCSTSRACRMVISPKIPPPSPAASSVHSRVQSTGRTLRVPVIPAKAGTQSLCNQTRLTGARATQSYGMTQRCLLPIFPRWQQPP